MGVFFASNSLCVMFVLLFKQHSRVQSLQPKVSLLQAGYQSLNPCLAKPGQPQIVGIPCIRSTAHQFLADHRGSPSSDP